MPLRVNTVAAPIGISTISFPEGIEASNGGFNATGDIVVNAIGVVTCTSFDSNLNISGVVTATSFVGDGSGLDIPGLITVGKGFSLITFLS